MTDYRIIKYLNASGISDSSLWIEEAKFGFRYISKKIERLNNASRILEVGCGTGILLSMLSEEFPNHTFQGVEPFGDGFADLFEINLVSRKLGTQIVESNYEQLEIKEKYDLIFCINVFEHVHDWRHLICWASSNLKSGGLFFVLCPNYGFPYESHFKIPIIWSKKLTFRFFKPYINHFERERGVPGLWDSLNFVRKSEVKNFVHAETACRELTLCDDVNIIDDMVERVATDPIFRNRQRVLGIIATVLKKMRVFGITRWAPNYLPYMSLTFERSK